YTMAKYIKLLKNCDITQFDGCGGVLKIWQGDTLLYDWEYNEEDDAGITVHEFTIKNAGYCNTLNAMLHRKLNGDIDFMEYLLAQNSDDAELHEAAKLHKRLMKN